VFKESACVHLLVVPMLRYLANGFMPNSDRLWLTIRKSRKVQYGHTEGKIVSGLIDSGALRPGTALKIEGILPPCPNCRRIMQWASKEFQVVIDYFDASGGWWRWQNGVPYV
jgi:hypothetical protein